MSRALLHPRLAGRLASFLTDTATVYTEDSTTGTYTVVARSGLACRLAELGSQPNRGAPDRSELAADRELTWDPSYLLPEASQLEISGVRWNPVAGTFNDLHDEARTVAFRKCLVVRA